MHMSPLDGPFERGIRCTLALGVIILTMLGGVRAENGIVTPLPIEGYPNRLSFRPGDEVAFHMSSRFPRYHVTIQRYGAKRETVWHGDIDNASSYPVPENASTQGCDWPTGFTLRVPDTWRSGYYEVFTGAPDPLDAERWIEGRTMFFVVRPIRPGREGSMLLQLSTNTYNAYNNWGGSSLYGFNSRDRTPAHRVSFSRPLPSDAHRWEIPFIEWAERSGYHLDYAVNSDLERDPELLKSYKLILSVGHDEYWSASMRDRIEEFVANGGNVAFFGGNNITWQVRYEDDGQTMVSWKERYREDPLYRAQGPNPLLTTLWSHPLVNRPENQLTGVGMMFGGMHRSHGQLMDGSGAFTVQSPDHWVFQGTGLRKGDEFGGRDAIVGYEVDGCETTWVDGRIVPTHRDATPKNFEILATAPASWPDGTWSWWELWQDGRSGNACLGLHSTQGGGTVFSAATTGWANGLHGRDPVVERITRNVLDRLSGNHQTGKQGILE